MHYLKSTYFKILSLTLILFLVIENSPLNYALSSEVPSTYEINHLLNQIPGYQNYEIIDKSTSSSPQIIIKKDGSIELIYDLTKFKEKNQIKVTDGNGNLQGIILLDKIAKNIKFYNQDGKLISTLELTSNCFEKTLSVKDTLGRILLIAKINKDKLLFENDASNILGEVSKKDKKFSSTSYLSSQIRLKSQGLTYDPSIDFILNPPSIDWVWLAFFALIQVFRALMGGLAVGIGSYVQAYIDAALAVAEAVVAHEEIMEEIEHEKETADTQKCLPETFSPVTIQDATLTEDFTLPEYKTIGATPSLTFIYQSSTAASSTIIKDSIQTPALSTCGLEKIGYKINIQGQEKEAIYHPSPDKLAFHYLWDGKDGGDNLLPTGSYPYEVRIVSFYEVGAIPFIFKERAILINNTTSPYGAGWDISGIPRLHFSSEGIILLVSADGPYATYTPDSSGGYTSEEGCCTFFKNPDGTYTRKSKDGTEYIFSSSGNLNKIIDTNGNTTTYTYQDKKLVKITYPEGEDVVLTYNQEGLLTQVTDFTGRTTNFTYDGNRNLTQITYPDNSTISYEYDLHHQLTRKTDKGGATTVYEYYSFPKYTAAGRVKKEISPSSAIKEFKPSSLQGLVNEIPYGVGTDINPAIPTLYKDLHNIVTDATGSKIINTDKFGNILEETDQIGRKTEIERDEKSNPTKITEPSGQVISMQYDSAGNLTKQTDESLGATTTFTYAPNPGELTSITDPLGNTTNISYDTSGNPNKITDALGNSTNMSYNALGLLTTVTDSAGNTTNFSYDTRGNLIVTQDPLGNQTNLTYDTSGNVTKSIDSEGRSSNFNYDVSGRLTKVTDAKGGTTNYTYDVAGNLTQVTDAKGQKTLFYYDQQNRLTKVVDALGNTKTFEYDISGNLIKMQDAKMQDTRYEYDKVRRLTKKTLPDNVVIYRYDEADNLTYVEDNDSSIDYAYDLSGGLLQTTTHCKGDAKYCQPNVTISYSYDKNGNRISMTDPTGTTNYTYDALDRLTRITDNESRAIAFEYDSSSRRTKMTYPNGLTTTYNYDENGQLIQLKTMNDEQITMNEYKYTYDKVGNRTSMTTQEGVHSYTYDSLYRLTGATHPTPENPTENFSYDAVGNRTTSHLSSTYSYNSANQLLSDNKYIYTYDANGNMISKKEKATGKVTTYIYNSEDQLIRINLPDGRIVKYGYDALGRRIYKDVNGTITKYVYDDEDILFEYEGNKLVARYTHGPDIDEPLIMERNNKNYYYHFDGLGSVTEITDSSGNSVNHYVYDSFGNMVQSSEAVKNFYKYTAREYDEESRLCYYRARYYDARVGRFLQKGIIDSKFLGSFKLSKNPLLLNNYTYVLNNPIFLKDPSGEIPVAEIVAIGIGIAFGIEAVLNIEIKYDKKKDEYTITIPPSIAWKIGLPVPLYFGIEVKSGKVKTPWGKVYLPKEFLILMIMIGRGECPLI